MSEWNDRGSDEPNPNTYKPVCPTCRMTMPQLMNCEHQDKGWCLDCVKELSDGRTGDLKLAIELLKTAKCPNCDGSGELYSCVGGVKVVTREMAIDAGDPSLEGHQFGEPDFEAVQCQWCCEKNELLKMYEG